MMSSTAELPPIHPAPPGFDRWSALHRLLVLSFAGMEGRIDPPSSLTAMNISNLEQMGRDEVLLLGLGANGDPVACAFLRPEPDALYLGKIAIHPELRSRGLLHHIIAAAEIEARRLGRNELELQTRIELIENHAAFSAAGFRQVAERAHPGFDRATTLIFRRPVAP
ncbi:MAG: GNAT family N-acetyltransferase [Marinobacter sp.]